MKATTKMLTAGAGAGGTLAARMLVSRVLLLKLRHDVRALNAGQIEPVLANFAPDAVLHFNDGEHRWAGDHRGKAAIALFLRDFAAAGLRGEIRELFTAGPPWRMTLLARFDDHARDPAGEEIYRNRTILLARTRWGRIVTARDFYEDTRRILALEAHLPDCVHSWRLIRQPPASVGVLTALVDSTSDTRGAHEPPAPISVALTTSLRQAAQIEAGAGDRRQGGLVGVLLGKPLRRSARHHFRWTREQASKDPERWSPVLREPVSPSAPADDAVPRRNVVRPRDRLRDRLVAKGPPMSDKRPSGSSR